MPENHKDQYIHIAKFFAKVAAEYGALEIFDSWELEVLDGTLTDYRKAMNAEPGAKIVVVWIIWPDWEAGPAAHEGMFSDSQISSLGKMRFDGKRMVLGRFEPIFSWREEP